MSILRSKFLQFPLVKKPLLFLYSYFWKILKSVVRNDKLYISIKYRLIFKKTLHWRMPQTFNEKMQWLKLYDYKPGYALLADKYRVKEYVKGLIGPEYVVPLINVWDNVEEIDFESLPDKFVLKCNHNSGGGVDVSVKTRANLIYNKFGKN